MSGYHLFPVGMRCFASADRREPVPNGFTDAQERVAAGSDQH
jgi:hypothetical protein